MSKDSLSVVFVGHVDHGKSSVLGRLLADTGSLPDGKLNGVRLNCERSGKPFEYAFLIDALRDEQDQGITIDAARIFFESRKRKYLVLDAPGHLEFLKNMVTGASRAQVAILVIDAKEGIQENSKRHSVMLSMLGVHQVIVLVNKMDLVDYSQSRFELIAEEFDQFLNQLDITVQEYLPVAALAGQNLVEAPTLMQWWRGPNLMDALDSAKMSEKTEVESFRMPVQGVYKFARFGDDRRIVAGKVTSGVAKEGQQVVFYPSMKTARIKAVQNFPEADCHIIEKNQSCGFTLDPQIYVTRGEIACIEGQVPPEVSKFLKVSLFWLGRSDLIQGKDYILKIGTKKVSCQVHEIHKVIEASELNDLPTAAVKRHQVAECTLRCKQSVAFDLSQTGLETSRFVIVDNYDIAGGGLIMEARADEQAWLREKIVLRNKKWVYSDIKPLERARRYNQKACLILITGHKDSGKKPLARRLESRLFEQGSLTYFLGIGNLLYGVDADIKNQYENQQEHMRRVAEVAHLLLDSGMILVLTAIDFSQADRDILVTMIDPSQLITVWVGEDQKATLRTDLTVDSQPEDSAAQILDVMQSRGIIFAAW